ncbi:MAG: TVP38/TMEM64 family protein [Clostridiales bacterium]|nr:TVP38/TMEM64 family protein [Candidatus Crickella equi]
MKKNIKLIIFCAIIVLILVLNHFFGWSEYLSDIDNLGFLSDMIRKNMLLAGLIYTGITIVACVVLALPGVTFAILSGVLFGPWWGTLWCLIATTLGAIVAFIVGRFFLHDSIKPQVEKSKLMKKLFFDDIGRSDVVLLAITRLVPLFPYNIQNFAYGITDMSLGRYSLFTFIFMIPGVALYTIGTAGIVSGDNRALYLGIAAVLLAVVLVLGWYIKRTFLTEEDLELAEQDKK